MAEDREQSASIADLLAADDAEIAALFERHAAAIENQGPAVACDRLIGRICETLSIQRLAEEEVLYPALRASDDKLVFAFQLAGLGISMRIGEIRQPGKERAARDFSVERLRELTRRNLMERSRILFPFVRGRLSPTQMVWLGDDYQQRKSGLWTNAVQVPRPIARKSVPVALWHKRAPRRDDLHPR